MGSSVRNFVHFIFFVELYVLCKISNIYDIQAIWTSSHVRYEVLKEAPRLQTSEMWLCVVWQIGTKCLWGTITYHIKDKNNRLPQNISTYPPYYTTAALPKVFNFNTLTQPTIIFLFSIPCAMCNYIIIDYNFRTEKQISYTSRSIKNIFKLIQKSKLI
jgi:hypothetical protein